jgi:hypothetical protein
MILLMSSILLPLAPLEFLYGLSMALIIRFTLPVPCRWWVVLWDLHMAKNGEGNGGTQNAHLYLHAHKQPPLGPSQPHSIPHGLGYPYPSGYQGQGGPQPHILAPGFQPQPMPVQERVVQQPNGPHQHSHLLGQMAVAPTAVGTTPRPLVDQPGGPQPTQNAQAMPNSGQLIPPGAHPAQPSQVQGVMHSQIPWHQFSQGQSGAQGPSMPPNPLASQQGPMLPGQAPVQSQMRAAHEYSQAQQQQHVPMSRQQSATGPNGAPQPQPGPTLVNGQPGRTLNVYQNPNIPSGVPDGVNGNPALPNVPPGPNQPLQVAPYPPQPYQPQAQQHPQAQNQNQPNPYPPSMLPPSFPPQPPQQPQTNPQPQTPRMLPSGPQTPGPGSQHVPSTPQQAPSDTPRTHPQQPSNFPFPSQQLAGANPNGGPNTPMNPPFTPSLQQQQQQRPFDGSTNNTPGPIMRPGTSMLPPQQPARVHVPVGMNSRFNPPTPQQHFGVGPPQPQQPGALGPVGYNGAMGTGGILPSGAAGAIHHGTGTPMPHSLKNFAAPQPQHQHQHQQPQAPPQPLPPQPLPQPQSQPQSQPQHQLQAQPQSSSSTPLPNGPAPNISRAPTPAQQQQPPVANVQRSATSTPAPNGANLGSNNVSPARGTSVARTGVLSSQQQTDAALQSLLPPGRQPAQHQQQAIIAMQRGVGQARSFNGPGPFASGTVSTPQQQAQHEVHAGMKRTGSPSVCLTFLRVSSEL